MGFFNALFTKKESLMLSNKWEFFITTVDDHVTGIRVDIGAIRMKNLIALSIPGSYVFITPTVMRMVCRSPMKHSV